MQSRTAATAPNRNVQRTAVTSGRLGMMRTGAHVQVDIPIIIGGAAAAHKCGSEPRTAAPAAGSLELVGLELAVEGALRHAEALRRQAAIAARLGQRVPNQIAL